MSRARFDTFLSVGGITIRVASDDNQLASPASGPLAAFIIERGPADVDIIAHWSEAPLEYAGRVLFESGAAWRLIDAGDELVFAFRSSIGGPDPYKVARFDRHFRFGTVALHRPYFERNLSAVAHPIQYPLDELVMIHQLAQGKGIEVHGCALLDRAGRAYVFAGQSGAGKSTMARLWIARADVTLLSDERLVLRTDRDRITVHGTPWQGDAQLASPLAGELAALFFLNQGPANTIATIGRSHAAARLFACSFLPFHSADAVDNTVNAIEQVTRTVPCCNLWFVPDSSAVDALTRHIG